LRQIRPSAEEETQAFLASPLRAALERSGDLIPSGIAGPAAHSCISPGELWLEHPRIHPISYPWEWTTAQWRAAAELTLRVASQAISAGWTLKDATPLNILFAGPRPILVDVLSFERRDPRSKVWLAYGQFVRTFLLPLVAAKYLSWPLQATLFARDGYEPGEVYRALPFWRRFTPDLLDVVTLATLFEHRGATQSSSKKPPSTTDPELAAHILEKRIARLGKQIRRRPGRWTAANGAIRTIRQPLSAGRRGSETAVREARARNLPAGARPGYRRQYGNLLPDGGRIWCRRRRAPTATPQP